MKYLKNKPKVDNKRGEICKIMSKMLDNPDKYGIYPTTVAYNELEKLITQTQQETLEWVSIKLEKLATEWDGSGNTGVQIAFNDLRQTIKKKMEGKNEI